MSVTDGEGGEDGPSRGRAYAYEPGPRPEPVDPDVDLRVPAQAAEAAGRHGLVVLAVVGAGGALGAVARYALSLWLPADAADGFPWAIFAANLSGCAAIGVLMALIAEDGRDARAPALLRPFLGVGVLGGFTTFSTYADGGVQLLRAGAESTALGYLGGTLLGAMASVWAGAAATRAALGLRGMRGPRAVRDR